VNHKCEFCFYAFFTYSDFGIVKMQFVNFSLFEHFDKYVVLTSGHISFQTHEVLKEASDALEEGMWLLNAGVERPLRFNCTKSLQRPMQVLSADAECSLAIPSASLSGRPTPLANVYDVLFVLRNIITVILSCPHNEYDAERIFFSTLSSICTISDCILRKLRGLLMVISLDCTKIELFEEGNFKSSSNKPKDKPGRKKKLQYYNTPSLSTNRAQPNHLPIRSPRLSRTLRSTLYPSSPQTDPHCRRTLHSS
jgi:hypothetical protein